VRQLLKVLMSLELEELWQLREVEQAKRLKL
jgi:hypothetical protein